MAFAVRKKIEPSEDWRDVFFDFLDTRLDKMLEEYPMADLREISKAVFQEKADILGHMILGLIERKFGHLLDQQKCACPQCGRNMQSNGKLSRRIETCAFPFFCKLFNNTKILVKFFIFNSFLVVSYVFIYNLIVGAVIFRASDLEHVISVFDIPPSS